jgi:hypothetical protein
VSTSCENINTATDDEDFLIDIPPPNVLEGEE